MEFFLGVIFAGVVIAIVMENQNKHNAKEKVIEKLSIDEIEERKKEQEKKYHEGMNAVLNYSQDKAYDAYRR